MLHLSQKMGLSQYCNFPPCELSFRNFCKDGIFLIQFGVNFVAALFNGPAF